MAMPCCISINNIETGQTCILQGAEELLLKPQHSLYFCSVNMRKSLSVPTRGTGNHCPVLV